MNRIRGVVFSLTLALSVLLLSLFSVVYDAQYYHDFQQSHDIPSVTVKTQEELDIVSADTIRYLQTGEAGLMRHYSSRATAHMVDVYGLFELARVVTVVASAVAALVLVQELHQRRAATLRWAMGTQVVLLLALLGVVLLATSQWDQLFTGFHHLFFSNDLWLLDPKTDLMIQMMPTPFFVGMASRIAVRTVLGVLIVDGLWLLWRRSEAHNCRVKGEQRV